MTISKNVEAALTRSSWVRKMFEEGARLKMEHGAENVCDFILGNPNLPPPEIFSKALKNIANTSVATDHAYMPNTGYPQVCKSVADYLGREQQTRITEREVIMTCGAAGGLNVIFKAILNPGDEVITPAPYFVEYGFYVDNHGGVLKTVPTKTDFSLDMDAISAAINKRTKAVLVNFPNNPTGQVYSKESIDTLGALLKEKGKALDTIIYLVSDDPYRKIVFDGIEVPSILTGYSESIIATSFSKDISIPGERIGFIAVHPEASFKTDLLNGMAFANRVLGFVNAPALMQRVVSSILGACVDVSDYRRKRDLLCDGLADCGYEFTRPPGTFYLFPKSPIPDDIKFVQMLQEELILVVPGSGFSGPGHFRISFCVDDETIIKAMPGFKRVMEKTKK
jgi:aspartate aminotransferase